MHFFLSLKPHSYITLHIYNQTQHATDWQERWQSRDAEVGRLNPVQL